MSRVPTYRGRFGPEEARRLLWRAGFGPRPGQAERLASRGLDRAVHSLMHPRSKRLKGPRPVDGDDRALAPRDAWGHDHCWWLDRMVRSEAPLAERMTLVWHDWFATSNANSTQGLMLRQNALLRRHALGSFERLAIEITRDPAMLLWLNGVDNRKDDVNENYARELMELFTLGAGRGYTERDAHARRRLPRLPDLVSHDSRICCVDHARAGAGLPGIEPGMPTPAGTGMSRRSFVLRSAGLALSVYGTGRLARLPAFEEGIARAAGAPGAVLVNVFLDGGADSLSILAPTGDPNYRRLRPNLALPASGSAFREDGRLTWHPAAAPLAALHAEGKVTVLPAVGYDHPDQSHFVSRHFWEVGAVDPGLRSGWLGRLLDRIGSPDNPLQGVSMGGSLGPSLATSRVPVAAVDAPEDFGFWMPGAWGPPADLALNAFSDVGRARKGSRDPAVAQAARAAAFAGGVRSALAPLGNDGEPTYTPRAVYPQSEERFPRRLAGLAAMLGAGLPIRCATLNAPGAWDTHADQTGTLTDNLKITADSLFAFQRDLEARGIAGRVLTLVWSEFGRRAAENGSGTDHGAAGIGFVIGTRATGRMVGEFPGLATLDAQGNLRATSDFRGLYASLCADWFGVDPGAVLPGGGSIPRPKVVR